MKLSVVNCLDSDLKLELTQCSFFITDFVPPIEGKSGISIGAVVGIVAAGAFVILLILAILWWKGYLSQKSSIMEQGIFKAINIVIIKISINSVCIKVSERTRIAEISSTCLLI